VTVRCAPAWLAVLGLASVARAELDPACRVEISIEPSRAIVGEQVRYRARVWMREDVESLEWSLPVNFPHVRSEALPGTPRPGQRERGGVVYRVRDELRALFAERSGSLRLAAPDLLCRSGAAVESVPVPAVTLEAREAPLAGRPAGWSGLIGPLRVHLTVTPRDVRLGESVRVAVMLRGAGNLWALEPPLAEPIGAAELFMQRPELVLERGQELSLRRHFVYDLVPRAPGPLEVPELAIPYFDPQTGSYAFAKAAPVTVAVQPRAAAAAPTAPRGDGSNGAAASPASQFAGGRGIWIAAGLGGLGVALGLFLRRRRRARSDPVAGALDEARGLSDAAAAPVLARALRAALARHVPDALSVEPEQLTARPGLGPAVAAAAQRLAEVERCRFDPQAPAPDVAAVERAIAAL
jgi:hypothetical protein